MNTIFNSLLRISFFVLFVAFSTTSCTTEPEEEVLPAVPTLEETLAGHKTTFETRIINRWWKYSYYDVNSPNNTRDDSAMFVPTTPGNGFFYKTSLSIEFATFTNPVAKGTNLIDYSLITIYDSTGVKVYTAKMLLRENTDLIFIDTLNNSISSFTP